MRTIILVIMSIITVTFAFAQSSPQHKFCYQYNPEHTHMQAYPGTGYYHSISSSRLAKGTYLTQLPQWQSYCPPCKLKDKSLCQHRPCLQNHLTMSGVYEGIKIKDNKWIKLANKAALYSVQHGGGPFGAVIVQIDDKTGKILRYWVNHNHVVQWSDPTAHAEISVIRAACAQLGVFNLGHISKQKSKLPQPHDWSHCVIYSSSEPCPMCLSAIYWAGIKVLAFSATRYDAAVKGVEFSDAMIYEELQRSYSNRKHMKVMHAPSKNALDAFNYYKRTPIERYGEKPGT